jgi:3-hydroxyethyl bacteriochlorophyllide a dehydrogenase
VWETDPSRRDGAVGYQVMAPDQDERRDYHRVCDVSGDSGIFDLLVSRLARGGEIVLAGFYERPISFAFPPAFMREARMRIAAEWQPADLTAVTAMVEEGLLSLSGIITHRDTPTNVEAAYERAFTDPACLKMVLDWRHAA